MKHTLTSLTIATIKTARPRQWIKNLALFAALVYSGFFFEPGYFTSVLTATGIFTLITSSIYIINDVIDAPLDRKHPFKKKRPIPSNQLPIPLAVTIAASIIIIGSILAWQVTPFLLLMIWSYVLLHIGYAFKFKHIPILDVFSIATGFIIRVYAGALVVNLHMSVWFLLTVTSSALFLAVGKRQSERTLLKGMTGKLEGHRVTLSRYTQRLLDIYTGMFANAAWLSYALFSFNYPPIKPKGLLLSLYTVFPKAFNIEKLMMATVPIVIYGVMRYLQLVYEQNKGESPERVLLSDKPLIASGLIYTTMIFVIVYWL